MDDKRASAGDIRQPSLEDFKGKVISEAMNPLRFELLIKKLGEMIPEDIEMIFLEVKAHVGMLMIHEFGSEVIQKIFAVCEEEQMNMVVSSIAVDSGLLMAICLNSWGSRSMLKLLDCLTTRTQLDYVMWALEKIIVPLANHPIGSTVIRQCFIVFPGPEAEPLLGMIAQHLLEIIYSEIGSRLVQAIISNAFTLRGQRRIVSGIMLNLRYLSMHQFGSHVVMHLIGLGSMQETMIYILRGCFDFLSANKYASNVVKKFIEASEGTGRHMIIDEIFNSPVFSRILQNPYGYSVIQFAKEYSTGTVLGQTSNQHPVVQSTEEHSVGIVRQTLGHLIQHSDHLNGPCPRKNSLPNKRRNHVRITKNHFLLFKRRKRKKNKRILEMLKEKFVCN